MCRNLGLISRWLFPRLSKRENRQAPSSPRSLCFLFTMNFPTCCPQLIHRADTSLLTGAYPRAGPAVASSPLFSIINVNPLTTAYMSLPHCLMCTNVQQLQGGGCVVFLPSHAAGGSDLMPPDLLCLASDSLVSPFF